MGTTSRARTWVAAFLVLAPTLLMLWPGAALRDQLPPETATHFGASGAADDWTDTQTYWLVTVYIALACGFLAAATTFLRHAVVRGLALALLGFIAGIMVGTWFVSAWVTMDAPAPGQEEMTWQIVLGIGPAILWAALVYAVHGRPAPPPIVPDGAIHRTGSARPPAPVQAQVRSPLMGAAAALCGGLGVLLGGVFAIAGQVAVGLITAIPLLIVGIWTGAMARATVRVDDRGFRLSAALGLPMKRIQIDDVAAVYAEDLQPMQWGGWGYRWVPGRSAYITGEGPGLVIQRQNGVLFAITLEDPEPFAQALEGYREGASA